MTREPISNADQAIAFLMSLVRDDPRPYAVRAQLPGLPVRALLERIGNPHVGLPAVHIAGSKGKGSTALYLEAILEACGVRTGTFTSPHLERWTERLRVGGHESTPQQFAALFADLEPHVIGLWEQNAALAPSFFDVLAAAAFLHFAEQRVQCAIVETGIGGTFDATNVVEPLVCCITTVELEHTEKLGERIGAIAAHKAGIIKPGVPVIIGRLPDEAEAVVTARGAALGAPIYRLGRDITLAMRQSPRTRISIRLPRTHATYDTTIADDVPRCIAENAALAAACAEHVAGDDADALADAIARGLPRVHLPGRMEVLCKSPWIIVDGAHTLESMRALANVLSNSRASNVHVLVSLSAGRDAATLLAPLRGRVHRVVATRADPLRSLESGRLASSLVRAGWDPSRILALDDARSALLECRATLAPNDLLCITGSMYMAGLARAVVIDDGATRRAAP